MKGYTPAPNEPGFTATARPACVLPVKRKIHDETKSPSEHTSVTLVNKTAFEKA